MDRERESIILEEPNTTRTLRNIKNSLRVQLKKDYDIEDKDLEEKILSIHGLSRNNFDFITNIGKLITSRLSDVSIDANGNKNEKTVMGLVGEATGPIQKAIGYDYLYRQMVVDFGKKEAKRLSGLMYDYSLPIHDSSKIMIPYSYYKHTPIYVRINGREQYITIGKLFEIHSKFKQDAPSFQYVKTEDIKRDILFTNSFMKEKQMRTQPHSYNSSDNTLSSFEEVTIEVWDNGKFVNVEQLTKHKHDSEKDFVVYQTELGDFAFVTSDHPVILEDGTEVYAADLKKGMNILDSNYDIPRVREYINIPKKLAYFLGFLLGDGNIRAYDQNEDFTNSPVGCVKFTRGGNLISIYQDDIENSYIYSLAKELFPNAKFFSFDNDASKKDRCRSFSSWGLSAMVSAYLGYNYRENSFSKHLPENFLNWKKDSKSAFIAGVIDSDGSVFPSKGRCDIRLKSYATINVLYDALKMVKARGVRKRVAGNTHNDMMFGVAFRPNEEIYDFSEKLRKVDKEDVLTYKEQYSIAKDNRKVVKIIKFKREDINKQSFLFNETEYVYDITTESGTFSANGMVQHNCFAFDASKIVFEGRPFGQLKSKPPKRISSYIASLNETVHQMSNHLAGAIAVGSFFSDLAFILINREKLSLEDANKEEHKKYIENTMQTFVHSVNHLSRLSNESPFSNVSIFDRPKLESLFSEDNQGWMFHTEEGEIDRDYFIDYVLYIQRIFLNFFDKGDPLSNGMPYRFPVVTVNISKDEDDNIVDTEFFEDIINREIFRYNIYTSLGTKTASCCFDKDEFCLVRDSIDGIQKITFEEAYAMPRSCSNFKVYHNGSFVDGHPVKIPLQNKKMYKITTVNNKTMFVTDDHIHVTTKGDVSTKHLTLDDYLLFNSTKKQGKANNDITTNPNHSYSLGVLLGAYIGDGSNYISHVEQNSITFSLNNKKVNKLLSHFTASLEELGIQANVCIQENKNNVVSVVIRSDKLVSFVSSYISGSYCYNKRLNLNCLDDSVEFRKGILDGHHITDGGNSNRIYTTSEGLVSDLEILTNSLGLVSIIDKSDRTDEVVVIRGENFTRNYPLYCFRWYSRNQKRSLKDVYKFINGNIYFKIKEIEEVKDYSNEYVYCFHMRNEEEPYFTLPNGIITHNCRLLSDAEMFNLGGQVNSFGGSALSLGSHRVSLVHTNRIALETQSSEKFYSLLYERIEDSVRILISHRNLITHLTEAGLHPFIDIGWISMRKMFSTIGLIGLAETIETLRESSLEDLLHFINSVVKEMSEKYKIPINIEQVPGESMAVRLTDIDRMLFGEDKVPYKLYSNQFIPLWEDATLFERMDIDGKYNKMFTGGGIVHFNLGEKTTPTQNKEIISYAIKSGCEHFALNAVYSKCEDDHTTFSSGDSCPICGKQVIEKLTRVVGFFTPISSWNPVRREWEFPKRNFINIGGKDESIL